MDVNSTVISEIISLLSDGKQHSLYSIHEKFNVYPSDIIDSIEFLNSLGLLEKSGKEVKLVPGGALPVMSKLERLLRNRSSVINFGNPIPFKKETLSVDDLYLPRFDILDSSLLPGVKKK